MNYVVNFLNTVYPGFKSLAIETKTEKEVLVDATELISALTASRDRWRTLALELKEKLDVVREQRNMVQGNDVYHFVIKIGMILNEGVRAIAALKEAGEWEE